MHSNSPSRRSTPENDGPVAVDELRAPSLNHVTSNAIASAAMRELLEMMVTPHAGQLRIHSSDTKCGLRLLHGCIYQCYESKFHSMVDITHILAELAVKLLVAPQPQSRLHTGCSVQP